jgi:hypothetical protein
VVLSDDLVWAYSVDAGGPLQPSQFSVQLPQSVVLKSAEVILRKYAPTTLADTKKGAPGGVHQLMNKGKPLSSGVSVVDLLREIYEEDRTAALSNATAAGGGSRRLSSNEDAEEQILLDASHRYLLAGAPGQGKGSPSKQGRGAAVVALSTSSSNTLIRLLHKISAADVAALQAGVRNASHYFQYYSMDANMRTDVTPLAAHTVPDGGAMEMLEQLLTQRKERGIRATSQRCQVKHCALVGYARVVLTVAVCLPQGGALPQRTQVRGQLSVREAIKKHLTKRNVQLIQYFYDAKTIYSASTFHSCPPGTSISPPRDRVRTPAAARRASSAPCGWPSLVPPARACPAL